MDALQGAIDVDTNIFFSINRMHNMYFDYFMSAYSGKWVWIPMYAAIWYVMLRNFHWKVTLFCMIGLALTITLLPTRHVPLGYVPMWSVCVLLI